MDPSFQGEKKNSSPPAEFQFPRKLKLNCTGYTMRSTAEIQAGPIRPVRLKLNFFELLPMYLLIYLFISFR